MRKIEGDYNSVVVFPAASFFKLFNLLVDFSAVTVPVYFMMSHVAITISSATINEFMSIYFFVAFFFLLHLSFGPLKV